MRYQKTLSKKPKNHISYISLNISIVEVKFLNFPFFINQYNHFLYIKLNAPSVWYSRMILWFVVFASFAFNCFMY